MILFSFTRVEDTQCKEKAHDVTELGGSTEYITDGKYLIQLGRYGKDKRLGTKEIVFLPNHPDLLEILEKDERRYLEKELYLNFW